MNHHSLHKGHSLLWALDKQEFTMNTQVRFWQHGQFEVTVNNKVNNTEKGGYNGLIFSDICPKSQWRHLQRSIQIGNDSGVLRNRILCLFSAYVIFIIICFTPTRCSHDHDIRFGHSVFQLISDQKIAEYDLDVTLVEVSWSRVLRTHWAAFFFFSDFDLSSESILSSN